MISKKRLDLFGIKKEYKSFNFPNRLDSFTQYYYYLREFGIIPKSLPVKKLVKVFDAVVTDYKEKHITYETLQLITDHLYNPYVIFMKKDRLPEYLEHLMYSLSYDGNTAIKLSDPGEEDVLLYANDPERYKLLYEERMKVAEERK